MGTPDETWGVNSLTIAVVCESWLWQSHSSRRAEPCQDGRRNSREFSGNGPAAGRVSSTPMKGLSYLGLDHTGFGWEVKVRLEILICYLDGDIGFFLASHVRQFC